ncbi:MAG: repeat-containing protein, partial [Planctomycetaceae bacterium]|nr:repeat-containing protein [Planctomycetaceae bacterium]
FPGQQFPGQQFPGQQFPGQPANPQANPSGQLAPNPQPPPAGGFVFAHPRRPIVTLSPPVLRGGVNINVGPQVPIVSQPHQLLPAQPSTLEQKARSIHFQGQGDIWFRKQNYMQAYSKYKQASGAASDLAAPRFRMAYAMIALKRYELAVSEMARGIQLDPKYPLTGDSPAKVFGPDNQIAAGALAGQVADWVRQEIQAPDRLFLLGALLRMNGDVERARICFQAAAQVGGQPAPVMAFLNVDPLPPADVAKIGLPGNPQNGRPPVPEAIEELLKNKGDWAPGGPAQPGASDKPIDLTPPIDLSQSRPKTARPLPFGLKLSGKPSVPSTPIPRDPAPRINLEDDDQPLPPVPTLKKPSEPGTGTMPNETEKLPAAVPGFQPIPKKDSGSPTPGGPVSDDSGPAIPIPQSGN